MCKSWAFTSLLLLAVITVTSAQYFDILQGLQQIFQPYTPSDTVTQYNGFSRNLGPNRQTNKQEKKKTNEQRNQDERRLKKPPTNQYDYIFASTTAKPSRKSTKSNSSQNNSSRSKNQYSNIVIRDYFSPKYESTTKSNKINRIKTTTTTESNYFNNFYNNENRATTEIVFNPNLNKGLYNRPVTENVFKNKNNHAVGNYQSPVYNQNRRPEINNQGSNIFNYPQVPPNRDIPQNLVNNNRGIPNDYTSNFQREPPNDNNPIYPTINKPSNNRVNNVGTNFGIPNTGFNTNNQGIASFGINYDRTTNRYTPNPYDRIPNIYGNTGFNNGGNSYTNGNSYNNGNTWSNNDNRGNSNTWGANDNTGSSTSNNWGSTNNRGNTNTGGSQPTNNVNINNRDNNNFNINSWGNTDYDPNNEYPTNPGFSLTNRPGVKPAPVDIGQPPITNKPVTDKNPYYSSFTSSSESSEDQPEILIGPDEDDMTERQKRRYVELSEKMCDRYKALNVKKVVALPLLPSPDPVELNVSTCTPINVPLIIGGKVVSIRDFPHMALVGWMKTRKAGYSWKCGGSLISNQYVLTAGHCTYQDKESDVVSGPPQAVQLGSTYLDDPGALVVRAEAVIRHPKYKMRRSYHDIALIKLRNKVTFSEVIRPACLGVPPPEGHNIIATGWGRTEYGGDHSLELRSVSLPVWNMEDCRDIWGTSLKLPLGPTPDSHVCAGVKKGGKDTCQGDSGGPAQVQDGCAWRVVAVTSYGRGCAAPQTPALYAVIPRAFVAAQVFGQQS